MKGVNIKKYKPIADVESPFFSVIPTTNPTINPSSR
jgi:hypothetical protein